MRHAGILVLLCSLLAGCPSSSGPDDPDAQPDSGMPDSAVPAGAGLVFRFESNPSLSGDGAVGGEYAAVIEEAHVILERVRAIGDAAPGDERTSSDRVELEWEQDSAIELRFAQAPPGMYAQLLGDIVSYELEGTLQLESGPRRFRIDESSADISVAVSLDQASLEPGQSLEVVVLVQLGDVVRAIDWQAVEDTGDGDGNEDELRIDESSSWIEAVRQLLADSFDQA